MRKAAFALILLAAVAGTSEAQVRRGNAGLPGHPPGQMPRAGECRVWYDGLPPGRQPAPTNCDQAERVASRSRDARVIYGSSTGYGADRYGTRNGDERYRDRTNSYPSNRGGYAYNSVPFQNSDRDGYEKARTPAATTGSIPCVTADIVRTAATTIATAPRTTTSWCIARVSSGLRARVSRAQGLWREPRQHGRIPCAAVLTLADHGVVTADASAVKAVFHNPRERSTSPASRSFICCATIDVFPALRIQIELHGRRPTCIDSALRRLVSSRSLSTSDS